MARSLQRKDIIVLSAFLPLRIRKFAGPSFCVQCKTRPQAKREMLTAVPLPVNQLKLRVSRKLVIAKGLRLQTHLDKFGILYETDSDSCR